MDRRKEGGRERKSSKGNIHLASNNTNKLTLQAEKPSKYNQQVIKPQAIPFHQCYHTFSYSRNIMCLPKNHHDP